MMRKEYRCSTCNRVIPNSQAVYAYEFSQGVQAHKAGCPFVCLGCRYVSCGFRATSDRSFVWPIPLEKTYVRGGVIERPPDVIDTEDELKGRSPYGIILSMGPGYWANVSNCCHAHVVKKAVPTCRQCNSECFYEYKFHPSATIPRGTIVVYDQHVPWKHHLKTPAGNYELVIMCGAADINGIVTDYFKGIE